MALIEPLDPSLDMADPKQVEGIYRNVIDDTVNKLAPDFENAGVSLQVLARLQEVCPY